MISKFRALRKRAVFGLVSSGRSIPIPFLEKYREHVYLREFLVDFNINCVLDVGANIGQFAEDLRLIGYTGKLISFEPIKSEFEQLRKKFAADQNWFGFQMALGSKAEKKTINISDDTSMASFLEFGGEDSLRHEEIDVVRLDDFIDRLPIDLNNDRILLKMDTQGFDLEVYVGAEGCIEHILGLMSEVSVIPFYLGMTDYKTSLTTYEKSGFHLRNLTVVARNEKQQITEMNCLMSR